MNSWVFIFLLLARTTFPAILIQCGDNTQSMEVVANSAHFTVTCDGYDNGSTVKWERGRKGYRQLANIGSCNLSTCTLAPGVHAGKISLNYVSATSSSLTSTLTEREDSGATYFCNNQACEVNIIYAPTETVLALNNQTGSLTVNESQNVVVTCLTHGRPTPNITISDESHDRTIRSESGRSASSELVFNISSTHCQNTTTYSCEAINSVGSGQKSVAELFVFCIPRIEDTRTIPTYLNYAGQAVSFTFKVIAYPSPEKTPQQCYNNSTKVAVTTDKCSITCTVTNYAYMSTCSVTIAGVTADDVGEYHIRLQNGYGLAADVINFYLAICDNSSFPVEIGAHKHHAGMLGLGLETAITLSVVVCCLGLIIIILWRRQWVLPCTENKQDSRKSNKICERLYGNMEIFDASLGTNATLSETPPNN